MSYRLAAAVGAGPQVADRQVVGRGRQVAGRGQVAAGQGRGCPSESDTAPKTGTSYADGDQ